MTEWISPTAFLDADGVGDWRVLNDGAVAYFATGSFAAGARLALAIGDLDGLGPRQPDVDVRHDGVTVRLVTVADDRFGVSERDVELARQISGIARELGATPDPSAVQAVQVAIDAMSIPEAMAFWRAVLGYEYRDNEREDLTDLNGRGPFFWFQQMDEPRPQRKRIHIDVWVPPEVAEGRVAAAIAAGGSLVSDAFAPAWWTLADPEGNEVDVVAWHEVREG
jgi:4a-hydroxytetrahydrobiopterin dehydratase